MSSSSSKEEVWDLAIVGGGPIGLEAAAHAREAGLKTIVIEAGAVAENVARWGAVLLFTPFGYNVGPAGRRALSIELLEDSEIITGQQFRDRYLIPLAKSISDKIQVLEDARVLTVARERWLKGEALGTPNRADQPFRLLIETGGAELELRAARVFDCSGSYQRPNWAGPGGAPARGERALREAIVYHLPDLLGRDRSRFLGARTLLLGGGHSAGTAALALAELALERADTCFTWASRSDAPAMLEPIPNDPLPERTALAERSRALSKRLPPGCERLGDAQLVGIGKDASGFLVELDHSGRLRAERYDHVIALVGYEPDDSLYRQLQIHECYASRGPMNLAAALLGAGADGAADCLAEGSFGPETLRNPEPDFFILGIKSYGKNSQFIMRTGYEQVADVFAMLGLATAR